MDSLRHPTILTSDGSIEAVKAAIEWMRFERWNMMKRRARLSNAIDRSGEVIERARQVLDESRRLSTAYATLELKPEIGSA